MREVLGPHLFWELLNPAPVQPDPQALARGRVRKRWNAVAALLSGAVPAVIIAHYSPAEKWLTGFLVGLLWANGFEYLYHRYLLHLPRNFLSRGHLQHHSSVDTPLAPDHVNLGSSPFWVVILFVINEALVFAFILPLHLRIASGMFLGFVVYQIVVEEFHWRIHLGGWLPPGLRWTREYHLAHHDRPAGRFNIFLPLFDVAFAFPILLKRPRPLPVFSSGVASRLTMAEKSMLAWLFALAIATNLVSAASSAAHKPKAAPIQHTSQTD